MKTKAGIEKPLAEWTAQEIKDICRLDADATACGKCPVLNSGSGICRSVPYAWKLIEKPKFTEQEVQDAKSITRIWGTNHISIGRKNCGDLVIIVNRNDAGAEEFIVDTAMFPSVQPKEIFHISEIVGDTNA